jgi:AcrR family transcriptional regulator
VRPTSIGEEKWASNSLVNVLQAWIKAMRSHLFTLHYVMQIGTVASSIISRGRPRDQDAQKAVLDAAIEIILELGAVGLTFDAIARRAGTSRPTLYRWWSSTGEILLDALLEVTKRKVAYAHGGSLVDDLKRHAQEYVVLLTGPYGAAYRAIFSQGLADDDFMKLVRDKLIAPRRQLTRERLFKAINSGELPEATDLDALIDALYAPFLYRLFLGHQKLTATYAKNHVRYVMKAAV